MCSGFSLSLCPLSLIFAHFYSLSLYLLQDTLCPLFPAAPVHTLTHSFLTQFNLPVQTLDPFLAFFSISTVAAVELVDQQRVLRTGCLVTGVHTPPIRRNSKLATLGRIFKPWKWRKKKNEKLKQSSTGTVLDD